MAKLRLVHNAAPTINPPAEGRGRWQGQDVIFFHKDQLELGTTLVNFGRLSHGSLWTVFDIKTYRTTASGRTLSRSVYAIQKLSDDVVLVQVGSGEVRQISFATLSYSAIWRIVQ
jgi:hypothetical protein